MSSTAESPGGAWVPEFTISDRLRKIRRDLRMTQEEFADLLGVKPERYGAWEAGRNRPEEPVETAKLIEERTGVPAWWTLGVSIATGPPPTRPSGGLARVRHQGLEPRTRWFTGGGEVRPLGAGLVTVLDRLVA
jgi:transcriptional regulator with XRE-family HTH domain